MDDGRTLRRDLNKLRLLLRQLEATGDRQGIQLSALTNLLAQSERFAVDLSPLAAGFTTVEVTWPSPFPDTAYTVYLTPIMPSANLGQVFATYGAKTTTGCTVVVRNTSGAPISAGLNALAIRT